MSQRRGGIIGMHIDGTRYDVKGSVKYNFGRNKKEGIVGHDGVHGYKELPQIPWAEVTITDRADLDVAAFMDISDSTVMFELANGKTAVLRRAWNASDGDIDTEEGEIECRFEGKSAEEV